MSSPCGRGQGASPSRPPSGLIPRFDGAILSMGWKPAPWDRFVTATAMQAVRPASRATVERQDQRDADVLLLDPREGVLDQRLGQPASASRRIRAALGGSRHGRRRSCPASAARHPAGCARHRSHSRPCDRPRALPGRLCLVAGGLDQERDEGAHLRQDVSARRIDRIDRGLHRRPVVERSSKAAGPDVIGNILDIGAE